jgi:hypothetical protein
MYIDMGVIDSIARNMASFPSFYTQIISVEVKVVDY